MFILKQRGEGDFHQKNHSHFILLPGAKMGSYFNFFLFFDLKNGPFPIQISCETARFWVNAIRVPYPA
jgi:hypothetical protein